MARSHRHQSIRGWGLAKSEKASKRRWNHTLRRLNRQRIAQDREPVRLREVTQVWDGPKDGKVWFDKQAHPRLMRK